MTERFIRGKRIRASLPSLSRNKNKERPSMGFVLLVFRDEVRRTALPDRVSHLDTVKSLFVRAFPHDLNLAWFNMRPGRHIYILNPIVNVFYQLEDVREVQHDSVLKVHEQWSPSGYSPDLVSHSYSETDLELCYLTAHMSSNSGQAPGGPAHNMLPPNPSSDMTRSSESTHICGQSATLQYCPTKTPGNTGRTSPTLQAVTIVSRHSHQAPAHHRHSEPHFAEMAHGELVCTCPPELHQMMQIPCNDSQNQRWGHMSLMPEMAASDPQINPSCMTRSATEVETVPGKSQTRMAYLESQLAHLTAWVQTLHSGSSSSSLPPPLPPAPSSIPSDESRTQTEVTETTQRAPAPYKPVDGAGGAGQVTPSNSSLDSAYSAKSTTSSETSTGQSSQTTPVKNVVPADNAALQKARSEATRAQLTYLKREVCQLRVELKTLRHMQVLNAAKVKEEINIALLDFKRLVARVPGGPDEPLRTERSKLDRSLHQYRQQGRQVNFRLTELEKSVDELREDVLHRKARVDSDQVESLAVQLSSVSNALSSMKVSTLPDLQSQMKTVLKGEMEVVVRDERFLKHDSNAQLEAKLKRCKKLTGMLFTLKRLSAAQEKDRPDQVCHVNTLREPSSENKRSVLQSIEALVPDHDRRLRSIQAADQFRETKKRMVSEQESLKFEKSIQLAQKQLREVCLSGINPVDISNLPTDSVALPSLPAAPPAVSSSSSSPSLPDPPSPANNNNNNNNNTSECRTVKSQPKVAFNETVLVEDGSRVLLNDDDGVPMPPAPMHLRHCPAGSRPQPQSHSPPTRRTGEQQVWQRQNQFSVNLSGGSNTLPTRKSTGGKDLSRLH